MTGWRTWQRSDWEELLGPDWRDDIMTRPVTDRYHAKQGRSTGRMVLRGDGRSLSVYLKRHHHLPRWRGLLARLLPSARWSPATQEAAHLLSAGRLGIPVPSTVAVGERVGPWGRLESFLAVEELAGMIPLHEAIPLASQSLDAAHFEQWKRSLAREVARLTVLLHRQRYFHKDLYLCHFYVAADDLRHLPDWPGRVFMIDFHRFARHRWTWPWWQLKDLAQLLYSSDVEGLGPRDRLRFWHAYRDFGGVKRFAPLLRQAILWKGGLYGAHNRKRRARSAQAARKAA